MNRTDVATQSIIDQSIVMHDQGQSVAAVTYLQIHRISGDVIKRVLNYPEQRRQYINDFVSGF